MNSQLNSQFNSQLNSQSHPIVFFDGECGLCSLAVGILQTKDKAQVFRFAPLQGTTAQNLLGKDLTQNLQTVVLKTEEKIFVKSDAVLKIAQMLAGQSTRVAVLLKIMWFVPRTVRDFLYDVVARSRHKFFPQKQCRVMSEAEQKAYLP